MGFIDLEKFYDRINRLALRQMLRMNDMGGKLLIGIKNMNVDSLARVRVKGGNEEFWIHCGARKGCSMFLWLFNVYIDAVMKKL